LPCHRNGKSWGDANRDIVPGERGKPGGGGNEGEGAGFDGTAFEVKCTKLSRKPAMPLCARVYVSRFAGGVDTGGRVLRPSCALRKEGGGGGVLCVYAGVRRMCVVYVCVGMCDSEDVGERGQGYSLYTSRKARAHAT